MKLHFLLPNSIREPIYRAAEFAHSAWSFVFFEVIKISCGGFISARRLGVVVVQLLLSRRSEHLERNQQSLYRKSFIASRGCQRAEFPKLVCLDKSIRHCPSRLNSC